MRLKGYHANNPWSFKMTDPSPFRTSPFELTKRAAADCTWAPGHLTVEMSSYERLHESY